MLKICFVHENFDLIYKITLGLFFRINVNFCFSIAGGGGGGTFCFGDDDFFAALDQFYLLNNV